MQRYPTLLQRLYQPFYLHRYGEHAPGESPATFWPIFEYDDIDITLLAQFNRRKIYAGYTLMGMQLDTAGAEAIEALSEVLHDLTLSVDCFLEAGQMLSRANYQCAHRRTAYEDDADPVQKRHLVRIFLRDAGARSYMG